MQTIEARIHRPGHSVTIQGGRVAGWLTPTPTAGDEIIHPMTSGRAGLYKLLSVQTLTDPETFIGQVEFLRHLR